MVQRFQHIDFMRGIAALLVMFGHLRGLLFQSQTELLANGYSLNLFSKAFYLTTSLGGQAVMIFFALSGYLVGGKALTDLLSGRFSWGRYMARRLTRLWIVILPALLLTLFFDKLGMFLTDGRAYGGAFVETYNAGPPASGLDHSWTSFLGNLLFLQKVHVAIFGSNGPMWSLTNEFWYYVVAPLIVFIFVGKAKWLNRFLALIVLGLLCLLLPSWLLIGGLVWALGGVMAWLGNKPFLERFWTRLEVRLVSLAIAFAAAGCTVIPSIKLDLNVFGLLFALTLPILARLPDFGSWYQKIARACSEISFTLYLTHFPFMMFWTFLFFAPDRFLPEFQGTLWFLGLAGVTLLWAAAVWYVFERHTDQLYAKTLSWIDRLESRNIS